MSDQEEDKENDQEEVSQPEQDATELLLRKVAGIIGERSVNYAIIINDGASPRWIVSDVYWAMGVFQLIARKIESGWDKDFYQLDEDEDDEDED